MPFCHFIFYTADFERMKLSEKAYSSESISAGKHLQFLPTISSLIILFNVSVVIYYIINIVNFIDLVHEQLQDRLLAVSSSPQKKQLAEKAYSSESISAGKY